MKYKNDMFSLIPISLLIMALGGVIYIVSDHLSEFSAKGGSASGGEDEEDESSFGIKVKLAAWINQLPWNNMKVQSLSFTQKFLHRMRIVLLKTDNHLMKLIGKISEKNKEINGNGGEKKLENDNNFWDDLSRDNQESEEILPALPELQRDEPESALKTKIEFVDVKNNEVIKKVDGILTNSVKKIKRAKKSPR